MTTADLYTPVYDLLNVSGVTSLLTQSYGVPAIFQVGRVPRSQAGDAQYFPYITISVPSDVDFSDKGALGGNAIVQVDVWDRSGSATALKTIMRACEAATVRQEWGVDGFITCNRDSSDVIADPDGLTMHGLIRLRVMYLD
jgi:hypothetical protein